MQSLCTSHYRYKSLQCCRGSKLGIVLSVTDGAKLAAFSEPAVISEKRDNWKAPLSSVRSDAIHPEATQPVLHTTVSHTTVSHTTVLHTAVRKVGRASCLSDSSISMNYLASSAVVSASVDYPIEFREKVGRTASYPALH